MAALAGNRLPVILSEAKDPVPASTDSKTNSVHLPAIPPAPFPRWHFAAAPRLVQFGYHPDWKFFAQPVYQFLPILMSLPFVSRGPMARLKFTGDRPHPAEAVKVPAQDGDSLLAQDFLQVRHLLLDRGGLCLARFFQLQLQPSPDGVEDVAARGVVGPGEIVDLA